VLVVVLLSLLFWLTTERRKFVEKEDHLQWEVVLLCHRPQALAFVFWQGKLERSNTAALDPLYDSRIERKSLRKKRKVGKKNTAALDPHQNCHKSDLGLKKGNTATINPLYDSRKLVFERSRENTATIYPLNDSRNLKNGREEEKRRSKSEKRSRIRLPTMPDSYTVLGPTA